MKIIQKPSCGIRAVFVFTYFLYLFIYNRQMSQNFLTNKKIKIKTGRRRRILVICLIVLLGAVCLGTGVLYSAHFSPQKLEVAFLDVGQGDSTLVKPPGRQVILIDGGPDNSVLSGLGKNLPFYRRRIDVVIVSHYHDDHVAGLVEVLNRYHVKKIIYPSNSPTSEISKLFLSTAARLRIPIIYLSSTAQLDWGADCSMSLLNPDIFGIKPDDNDSLVAKLDCRQTKFLFSGDNSSKVEQALIDSGDDWSADVLKASHHGSITASSIKFLNFVQPKLFVISVGVDNRFGHPSPIVLDRVSGLGITIKRTDQEGIIKLVD